MSPNFYDAIQQPNATLVTDPIERIEPEGIRTADGTLHELDVLVLATGFQVDRFLRPIEVVRTGRGQPGRCLGRAADRLPLHLDPRVPQPVHAERAERAGRHFTIEVAELQFDYALQLIERVRSGECREISPSAEATDAHEAARVEQAQNTVWMTGCQSWYLDDRGVPAVWPWTFDHFREVMAEPDLDAYELV